jgi:holliday junction DNA helicase RuvA
MISLLEGVIEEKTDQVVVLNVNGIGYEVHISDSTRERLPGEGNPVKLHISETFGMYGGATTLYGFATREEKDIFCCFKDGLKNTGAKKSLDYLDKAMKSLPDFKRAVMQKNIRLLTSIFGFRAPTAEKIVTMLQDKLAGLKVAGREKWTEVEGRIPMETLQALVALGYKEAQANEAVKKALSGTDTTPRTEELVKLALKYL